MNHLQPAASSMSSSRHPVTPGYGRMIPILLVVASIVCGVGLLARIDRNAGFHPMDPSLHARMLGYIDDPDAAEGQIARVRLHNGDRPLTVVSVRDDRPWRTLVADERVRLLMRPRHTRRGSLNPEYIVDDFASKWGGIVALGAGAVLCDIAAVAAMLLSRRRPSAASRFPPPVPRAPKPEPPKFR